MNDLLSNDINKFLTFLTQFAKEKNVNLLKIS